MFKFFSKKKVDLTHAELASALKDIGAEMMLIYYMRDTSYFSGILMGKSMWKAGYNKLVYAALEYAKTYEPLWCIEEYQLFHLLYDWDYLSDFNGLSPHRVANAPGYVYLVKSDSGHYKIGKTVNIDDRRKTFSVKLPFEIEFENTIKCEDYHTAETKLHYIFRKKRANGEWFNLSAADVNWLKSIKEIN